MPVPDTQVTPVRHPYRYRAYRYRAEHTLAMCTIDNRGIGLRCDISWSTHIFVRPAHFLTPCSLILVRPANWHVLPCGPPKWFFTAPWYSIFYRQLGLCFRSQLTLEKTGSAINPFALPYNKRLTKSRARNQILDWESPILCFLS